MEAKTPGMKSQSLQQGRNWACDLADEMELPGILKLLIPRKLGPVENSLLCSVESHGQFPGGGSDGAGAGSGLWSVGAVTVLTC